MNVSVVLIAYIVMVIVGVIIGIVVTAVLILLFINYSPFIRLEIFCSAESKYFVQSPIIAVASEKSFKLSSIESLPFSRSVVISSNLFIDTS